MKNQLGKLVEVLESMRPPLDRSVEWATGYCTGINEAIEVAKQIVASNTEEELLYVG